MRPCVVGIGGAGGKILKQFLHNEDVSLEVYQFGMPLAFGNVKGVWLESAIQDAEDQSFYGDLSQGNYPGYLICHGLVDSKPLTNSYIMATYGLNLKARGYDRRAEYLKAVFEIFEYDSDLKAMSSKEFKDYKNPLSGYMWMLGIRHFVDITKGKYDASGSNTGLKAQRSSDGLKSSVSKGLMAIRRLGIGEGQKPSKLCDSILFLASLGGGTGTGFINPITSYVREENADFPIFAMGILTEKGSDDRHAPEGKRDLGAIIAMHDLLTKESGMGIDALLPVDNQILVEKYGKDFSAMDSYIYRSLKPLLDSRDYPGFHLQDDAQAIRGIFREVDDSRASSAEREKEKQYPPVLVPCYHAQRDYVGSIDTLVEGALGKPGDLFPLGKDGRLFPCDPAKADRALIFTRGFFSAEEIMEAVQKRIYLPKSKIKIYRKLGDSKNEDMLILLRNPYGGTSGEHVRKGTLEWRLYDVITQAIDYIDNNKTNILDFDYKPITTKMLENYFYGKNGLRDELIRSKERLENGDRQIFSKPLYIFKGATPSVPTAQDACKVGPAATGLNEARLKEIVKTELKEILTSDECVDKIKRIINS